MNKLHIGGDGFFTKMEKNVFKKMIVKHGKALSFSIDVIGCIDPQEVTPMVIFNVPHVTWKLKPIPELSAMMSNLVKLLKDKLE